MSATIAGVIDSVRITPGCTGLSRVGPDSNGKGLPKERYTVTYTDQRQTVAFGKEYLVKSEAFKHRPPDTTVVESAT